MRQIFHLTLMILAVTISHGAHAHPKQLTCKSTVYEPFVIEDSDGSIRGLDVDVVREIGRRLGIRIHFAIVPWRRLEERLADGLEDCVFAYFRTPERLHYARYMGIPLHITRYSLFAKPALAAKIHDISDLKGMTIGFNQGFQLPQRFAEERKEGLFRTVTVREDEQSFRMLNLGRLDMVLTNEDVGRYISHRLHLDIQPINPPLTIRPAYLVLSTKPSFKPLKQQFDRALWQILVDGTYRKLCQHYLPKCGTPDVAQAPKTQ